MVVFYVAKLGGVCHGHQDSVAMRVVRQILASAYFPLNNNQ